MKYLFRNDYSFGAHPKVLTALAETSMEGNAGYGEDGYCKRCADLIRGLCNCPRADVQFLIGGTQTNFTAIAAFLRPWEGVIAADSSHINGHEVGAVEATGHKILPVPTGPDGKITPEQIAPILERHKDPHLVKPRLVEIADATESGMVYTKAELTALSQFCREHDLLLFLDGARLGSALASPASDLTLPDLAELTDAFYIGGTKVGALCGEAVVFPHGAPAHFMTMVKQQGALLAKGRLMGIQFDVLFTDGLYTRISRNAIETANALKKGLAAKGYRFFMDSPTNQLFVVLENTQLAALEGKAKFGFWEKYDDTHTVMRIATSWATRMEEIEQLIALM